MRIRVLRFIGVGTVIVVAVVVGAYLLTHSSGTSPNAAGTGAANAQPGTGGTTPAAATPTASSTSTSKSTTKSKSKSKSTGKATSTTDATQYTLSTPAVAGGYQMGQDPHFLATATTTAQSILNTVSQGGGGSAKGSATSASYMLAGDQVVTVVAYHGSFKSSQAITSMGSYGSTDGTYSDPTTGGQIACANAPASGSTPSGAVCMWVTSTTIGVTEFFDATGPETLTSSQDLGAKDTAKIQASVESKK